MTQQEELDQLKQEILSQDWEKARDAAYRLGEIGGDEVLTFLIQLLNSKDPILRNCAALGLKDIKDNKAVEPLLDAIFKKENHNYNGTLVFALEDLDCSQKLKEIFKILFYESYEAKISAYAILSEQVFEFSEEDLLKVKEMWEEIKQHPEKCPNYEYEEVPELIQDAVDGYMGYLQSEE
ncbi:HEAT repeat domain-containing protein [Pontibacter sp. HSC-36F09]|uniref:HEAT repeat domain-containing protein n=1 Tax=Pontibacter sp. HSC-36F09 TaxID=2910966 RepID=UPI00209F9C0F|nr:HEAT repeat domain-containing protein [Pontibacter sp. HSC-36F09]MCP2045813.1 HEAT repeat protein [Pontibacter sp. HSC-36F09]